ncbi:sensor histidine kinase [Halostreptopolyspora alba]|uniref:histidine kinase n=1 Tax=Halostreptopolyspora alba TaxID=2487137 RepID=A0A3N0E9W6_9ACTN|nr:sensor histidine kinase [Nocardiopsaceae bacterium YIM 96095]
MRPRFTLAGQFLALQLAIVVAVLLAVVGVSVAQADAQFRRVEGQAMLSVAESAAAMEAVRAGLSDSDQQGILQPTAESLRSLSDADHLIITGTDRRMLSSVDPREIGEVMDFGESSVLSGNTWIGVVRIGEKRVLAAHVPVIDDEGRIIGVAAAGRDYPGPVGQLATAAPTLLVYVGIASLLGVVGSLLLSRRIKRQTLGLEPGEITRLAEDRTAMLHGIKEGVLGLDQGDRVTLVNDKAAELLDLPGDAAGRTLDELGVAPDIRGVLTDEEQEPDRVVLMGDRLVTLNSMPLNRDGRNVGSVTTMRDRTDLARLQQELDLTRTTTEALRAQAHEFSNQIHVITGLLELEEYDEAARYVSTIGGARTRLSDDVTSRVADSSVAALLIAKASLAAEQDVALRVSENTELGSQDAELSADLVTVVGNLVDNALDAVRGQAEPWVEVELAGSDGAVRVRVRDSGRGVPPELVPKVFLRGFSTKGAERVYRGVGLALVHLVCSRRGGSVEVNGAEFTASLPSEASRRPPPG